MDGFFHSPRFWLAWPTALWLCAFMLLMRTVRASTGALAGLRFYRSPLHGKMSLIIILFVDLGIILSVRVLDDAVGCQSPAAYGSTISRIAASIMPNGYVFITVALCMLALIFITEVDVITRNRVKHYHPAQKVPWRLAVVAELMIRLGFGLTTVTALLPDEADNCHVYPGERWCWQDIIRTLHLAGMSVGMAMSTLGALLRLRFTIKILPVPMKGNAQSPPLLSSLAIIGLATIFLVAIALVYLCLGQWGTYDAQQMHICILYSEQTACEGAIMQQRHPSHQESASPWPCSWNPEASFAEMACTDSNCDAVLGPNKMKIVLEYLSLIYWILAVGWVVSFIQDVEVDKHYGDPFFADEIEPLPGSGPLINGKPRVFRIVDVEVAGKVRRKHGAPTHGTGLVLV